MPPVSSPRAAIADLLAVIRRPSRERLIGGILAILSTIIIIILFLVDPQINTAPPRTIIFVESYGPERTDADIKRDQIKDQKARDAFKEAKKKQFQKLEKQLGM